METLSRVLPDSTPQLVDSANGSASASASANTNANAMANPTGQDSDAVPAGGDGSVSDDGFCSGSDSDSSTADSSTTTQQSESAETAPRRASYFVAADELPEPLPTDAAIAAPTQVLKDATGCMVVRVGEHYVVKYGVNVSLTEGENMLFARDTCGLPVPRVYAFYSRRSSPSGRHMGYIVMECVRGATLLDRWSGMSDADKADAVRQLRRILDKMRSVPSPGYYGCIGRRPFEESLFWSCPDPDQPQDPLAGPFDTEDQFNGAVVDKYLQTGSDRLSFRAAFYRRAFPSVLHGHRSVFTHGDLQRKNIVVRDSGEIVLIDWESSGWLPSYWEYAVAMISEGDWRNNWHEYVADALDEYHNEYLWLSTIFRELWC
ncbi:phosphotransferase enzyme family protein [Lasiosphaeria ovina]|uniref:Phosphotransferase enzyme family protein n=1 Tax=Lasiosphaeria ovina TaxID=92902 RepID=A0AAE0K737_9PEZI|nr:phosphotransferase enzyme family protein [Lasiosphaeria ovina]